VHFSGIPAVLLGVHLNEKLQSAGFKNTSVGQLAVGDAEEYQVMVWMDEDCFNKDDYAGHRMIAHIDTEFRSSVPAHENLRVTLHFFCQKSLQRMK